MSEETQEIKKWCLEIAAETVGKGKFDANGNSVYITRSDAIEFAQEMYNFLTEGIFYQDNRDQ